MSVLRSRGQHEAEVDTEGSWAISYGDMITLLLTFFILFFSTDHQKDRMEAMEASLMAKLESKPLPKPADKTNGGQDPAVPDALKDQLWAKVHKVGNRLIVDFPAVSFYNLGKVDLTKAGKIELDKFVKIFMPYAGNYLVSIRAFTDNKKVLKNSRFKDNLELSALRSVAAMRHLQAHGVPLNRIRLGGYGELRMTEEDLSRTIASTPDYYKNGLALARKVVLVIEPEPRESL